MKLLALVATVSAVPQLNPDFARSEYIAPEVYDECYKRGITTTDDGYANDIQMVKCRAMVVDIAKHSDLDGRVKNPALASVMQMVCSALGHTEDGEHLPRDCYTEMYNAFYDMKVIADLDTASDAWCAEQPGMSDWSAAESDAEVVSGWFSQDGSRCRCLNKIKGAFQHTNLNAAHQACGAHESAQCDMIRSAHALCEEYGWSENCKDMLMEAYYAPHCGLENPVSPHAARSHVIAPEVYEECHLREITATNQGYADKLEKVRCRAMIVDIAKHSDLDDRVLNPELANVMRTVCAGLGFPAGQDNHIPRNCHQAMYNTFYDMAVIADLDTASDAWCAEKLDNWSAADSDFEVITGQVVNGGARCRCLNQIKETFEHLDIVEEFMKCGGFEAQGPFSNDCKMIRAAGYLCMEYQWCPLEVPGSCKAALMAAYYVPHAAECNA